VHGYFCLAEMARSLIVSTVHDFEKFTLVLSRCDDLNIWGPYKSLDNNTFIAICGRIALESKEWEEAKEEEGGGGLACKAIYKLYKFGGIDSLRKLNGNYMVFVYDSSIYKIYVFSCEFPCFANSHSSFFEQNWHSEQIRVFSLNIHTGLIDIGIIPINTSKLNKNLLIR